MKFHPRFTPCPLNELENEKLHSALFLCHMKNVTAEMYCGNRVATTSSSSGSQLRGYCSNQRTKKQKQLQLLQSLLKIKIKRNEIKQSKKRKIK